MENYFLYSFLIAVLSVTYICILSREPILNWWFKFGFENFQNRFFYKPIWECEKCFSGQLSLWFYVLSWIFKDCLKNCRFTEYLLKIIPLHSLGNFCVINGLFFVSLSITFTLILSKLILTVKNYKP